jgi:uncharacterized protein YukE
MNQFEQSSAEIADVVSRLRSEWEKTREGWQDDVAERLWADYMEEAVGKIDSLVDEMQQVASTCREAEISISESKQP